MEKPISPDLEQGNPPFLIQAAQTIAEAAHSLAETAHSKAESAQNTAEEAHSRIDGLAESEPEIRAPITLATEEPSVELNVLEFF